MQVSASQAALVFKYFDFAQAAGVEVALPAESAAMGDYTPRAPPNQLDDSIGGTLVLGAPWDKVRTTLCPYVQSIPWYCSIRSSNRFAIVILA
jgi:hypothetical protein